MSENDQKEGVASENTTTDEITRKRKPVWRGPFYEGQSQHPRTVGPPGALRGPEPSYPHVKSLDPRMHPYKIRCGKCGRAGHNRRVCPSYWRDYNVGGGHLTVAQLIEHLQKSPPDAGVVFFGGIGQGRQVIESMYHFEVHHDGLEGLMPKEHPEQYVQVTLEDYE